MSIYKDLNSTNCTSKVLNSLIGETPTPNRLLKQCEDIFQDIPSLNPFDFEFRKASQTRSELTVEENIESDSLETPRIFAPVDSDKTISSISPDDENSSSDAQYQNVLQSSIQIVGSEADQLRDRKKLTLRVTNAKDICQSINIISTPTPVITAGPSVPHSLSSSTLNTPNILSSSTLNTPNFLGTPNILNTPNILKVNIPHITLNGGELDLNTPAFSPAIKLPSTPTSVLMHSNLSDRSREDDKKTNVVLTSAEYQYSSSVPISNNVSSTQPQTSSTAAVLQIVLRLPNGQSIPVEIANSPVISNLCSSTLTTSTPSTVCNIAPLQTNTFAGVNNAPKTASLAKLKLKEALASSCTAARPGVTIHSRATTADRIAEMTRTRNQSGTSTNVEDYQDDSNSSCSSGTNTCITSNQPNKIGRKRRSTENMDDCSDDKRKKFLERNRAAAVKCREKKKRLVQSIASKSAELGMVNQRLHSEVTALRSEVASLKSLLLRHKNCPVSMALQEEENEKFITPATASNTECKNHLRSSLNLLLL